jgi:O-antigen/teichoic acid export membrane protein
VNEDRNQDRSEHTPDEELTEERPPEPTGDAPPGTSGVATADSLGEDKDDSYVARVARGAGISTAGQGVGRVLGFLTQAAISQLFGLATFGFYTSGVAAVNLGQIISRFGMENGVVRYVAHHRARGDTARVRGTIIQTIFLSVAVSLVLSLVMFFGAGFMAERFYDAPIMETVLRAFAITLPFFTFMMMVLWATQGFQTVTYASYVQQMIRPALYLLLLPVFYVIGAGIVGVIAAYGISMLLGSVLAVYFLRKLFPELFDNKVKPEFETKDLFSVSIPMSITTGAQYLNTWSAVWIIGYFAAGAPVGIFTAAARTATLSTIVRFAFSGIFSPIISSLHSQGDRESLGTLYKDISRWIFTGAFALFLVIVLLADDVLTLGFGRGAAIGVTALIIVAFAQLFSSSVGPTPRMLAMTDNQNIAMIATGAASLVGVAVSFAAIGLAPTSEGKILGAAIGMASAIVAENAATLLAVKRRLNFWPYNLAWLKPLGAGLISAGLAYLVGILLSLPSILNVAVVGAVFGVAYLILLYLFGLNETDKEFLTAFWRVARRFLPARIRDRFDRG